MNKRSIQKNTVEILRLAVPSGLAVATLVSLKTESFMVAGIVGTIVTSLIIILAMLYKEKTLSRMQMYDKGKSESKPTSSLVQICPNCGSKLVLRNGKRGKFYGCSAYPTCKFTKDI
jgi:predicted RNA-binding Zn-ribbon protein involved in translation (DUF1610 family)